MCATKKVAGIQTAANISPVNVNTDMYWKVLDPISLAFESSSGKAMVKHSDVV